MRIQKSRMGTLVVAFAAFGILGGCAVSGESDSASETSGEETALEESELGADSLSEKSALFPVTPTQEAALEDLPPVNPMGKFGALPDDMVIAHPSPYQLLEEQSEEMILRELNAPVENIKSNGTYSDSEEN